MSEIMTFGTDNEDIKGGYKKYQGKKGETHRAGFVYSDPKSMFAGAKVHYNQRYFLCKKTICCDKQAPRWRVGTVIVLYSTDKLGNPKMDPFSYEILPWMFSEQSYNKLRVADSEFPLISHDVKITCTNQEYQNLDINSCKESIWQMKEDFKKKVLEEAKPVWEHVKKNLASDLSVEEIKDLISGGTEGGADPSATNVNLEDVLKNV